MQKSSQLFSINTFSRSTNWHDFETGVLNTLKYTNSSSLRFLDDRSKNTFRRDLNFKEIEKKIENWPAQFLTHAHSRITKVEAAMKSCSPFLGLTCSKAFCCQGKYKVLL